MPLLTQRFYSREARGKDEGFELGFKVGDSFERSSLGGLRVRPKRKVLVAKVFCFGELPDELTGVLRERTVLPTCVP